MSWMVFCYIQYHSRYNIEFPVRTEHNYSMHVLLLSNQGDCPAALFCTGSQDLSTWILRSYRHLITPSPRIFPVSPISHNRFYSHVVLILPGYASVPPGWHSVRCKSFVYLQYFQSRKIFLRTCSCIAGMIQIKHPEPQMYLHLPEQFQVLHIFQLCCVCIYVSSFDFFVSSS